jgi:hypothetical protein
MNAGARPRQKPARDVSKPIVDCPGRHVRQLEYLVQESRVDRGARCLVNKMDYRDMEREAVRTYGHRRNTP